MIGLFKSKRPTLGRGLFLINFKLGRGSNRDLPVTLARRRYVSAYVTAEDQDSAVKVAVTKLTSRGFDFVDTQGPITRLEPRQWSSHVAQSWPEFIDELPNQNEIVDGFEREMVFFGPFVGYKETDQRAEPGRSNEQESHDTAMATFEWIIMLLLGAALLAALARKVGAPYPTFLALGGAALAFVPASPSWTLDPQLALTLFVAPVLLDAAYDTSLRDLRLNWRLPSPGSSLPRASGRRSSPSHSPCVGWCPKCRGRSPSRWARSLRRPMQLQPQR